MKKAVKIIVWILILGALGGGIAYRFLKKKPVVQEETRPAVVTELPQKRDIVNYTEAIGTAEHAEEVSVFPKMAGEITELRFELGSTVNEGDTLAVLHSDALKSLELQVASAKVARDDAAAALQRTQALFATGAVSEQQLEAAQSAAKSTALAFDSANTQLELQKSYTEVKAPISGTVETKNADVHDMAAPSSPLCVLTGEGGMSISFGVPETVKKNLSVGGTVEIDKGGTALSGTVTEIGEKVSDSNGLYPCKAALNGDTGMFTSGTKAKVRAVASEALQVKTVPVSAVSYAENKGFVYVLRDSKAVKTDVETGLSDSSYIEITDGLAESDPVITTWSKELYNGAEVIENGITTDAEAGTAAKESKAQ